tara:strand:- start:109 stop:843 length:735 start_codon:yes stop_codon:yes gene_type:complete
MADNRIRLKQLYTPELSGYILSISSGEQGATGATGPAGTGMAPSGVNKAVQYRNGDQWGGSTLYYDSSTENLGIGETTPTAKISFGDYSSSDNSTPAIYFHESGAGKEYGINFDQTNLNYFISTGGSPKHAFGTLSHLNAFTEHFSVSNAGEVNVPVGSLKVSSDNVSGAKTGHFGEGIFVSGGTVYTAKSGHFAEGAIVGSGYADLPTGSSFPGVAGEFAWGSGHFYLCTGANSWGRVQITGF